MKKQHANKCAIKRLLSIALLFMMMVTVIPIGFGSEANAASVCNKISGNSDRTVTFTVKTDKQWHLNRSLTLTQTMGVIRYTRGWGWKKTDPTYAIYQITVKDKNGKIVNKYNKKKWSGKSFTIKGLAKNSKYTITVSSPDLVNVRFNYFKWPVTDLYWYTPSTWSVTKTKNITLCR